jgi:hypothetical protein
LNDFSAFAYWLRSFLHQDYDSAELLSGALVDESLELYAGDRVQCVEDIRRFRVEFPTPPEQVEAAKRLGSYYNGDAEVFAAALDQLEGGLVEEIETGISRRASLDDE